MTTSKYLQANSNSSLKGPQDPRKTPYKFLPRSLRLSSKTNAFRNCRVKGFYLKKILDYCPDEDEFEGVDFKLVSHVFKNKKIHKTLRHVKIYSFFGSYVHQCLKASKNLQTYELEFCERNTEIITFALRRLPANIQSVCIIVNQDAPVKKEDVYHIARSIRRFHKLQSFQRELMEHPGRNNGCYIQKELAIYSRSVKRLKEMKRMTYSPTEDDECAGLQRALRRGFVYPGITGLNLYLWKNQNLGDMIDEDLFLDFEKMTPHEQNIYRRVKNEIRERDKAKNDDIDWSVKTLPDDEKYEAQDFGNGVRIDPKFLSLCRIREDLGPFYRFELFPDLKELILTYGGSGNTFGSFVINGFRALKNLQSLRITIRQRLKGMVVLFTALLELPLLKKFSLSNYSLNNEELGLFGHFVHAQNKIQEFHFRIEDGSPLRTSYLQQNDSLKRTLQYLKSNFSMKSLDLDFPFVSLETLSQGLSHIGMMNQLHTFKFKASDDILTSQEKPLKRVEGLCQFIKNQNRSLKTLHIDLPLALEDTLINHIAEAVSQLSQLNELLFRCNDVSHPRNHVFDYYQKTLQLNISPEFQKKIALPEKWNPRLAKNLNKLANLEKFILDFNILCTEKMDPTSWFVDVVTILPDFQKLKTLELCAIYKDGSLGEVKTMFLNQFLCLPHIKNIMVAMYDFDRYHQPKEYWSLEDTAEEINERQARKNDYLFY